VELDFSEFHPTGDHWPGTARCQALYGGWRRHLYLAWVFHRRDQVLGPFRKVLCCPFGRHRWQVWYSQEEHGGPAQVHPLCPDCETTRLPSEHDVDNKPDLPWLE
jgi:hypothetical protein